MQLWEVEHFFLHKKVPVTFQSSYKIHTLVGSFLGSFSVKDNLRGLGEN